MRAAIIIVIALIGCSDDSTTTPTTSDTGTATSDTSTTTTDTSMATDTTTATDSSGDAPACPSGPPKTGDACTSEGQKCSYPIDCGPSAGDFATCTAGKWNVVRNPCTTGDTGPG
jgi:hypothetical protein